MHADRQSLGPYKRWDLHRPRAVSFGELDFQLHHRLDDTRGATRSHMETADGRAPKSSRGDVILARIAVSSLELYQVTI